MIDWNTVEEWSSKYGRKANLEAYSKYVYITRIFNLAGLYLEEDVDLDLLFELYPIGAVIHLWERFEPVIMYQRETANNLMANSSFEKIYREARKKAPDLVARDWSTYE